MDGPILNGRPAQHPVVPIPGREYVQRFFHPSHARPHRHALALRLGQGIGCPMHGKAAPAFL